MAGPLGVLTFSIVMAFATSARAATQIFEGTTPANDTENILFNGAGIVTEGTTVTGRANQSSFLFDVHSNDSPLEILVADASGQAVVSAKDGGVYKSVIFQMHDPSVDFRKLAFSVSFVDNGKLKVTASSASAGLVTETFNANKNLEKYFTISDESDIQWVKIEAINGATIDDIKQIRVGGAIAAAPNPGPVPVPAAAWAGLLLMAGLGAFRAVRRQVAK